MRKDKRVFALGFFDGVHLGHQALLRECVAMAEQLDCASAAITFDRHPKALFTQDPPPLLSTAQTRSELLQRYGIDHIYTFPVVEAVMSMSWRDFLQELLEFGAAGFVCGHDFRFGNRGEGNAQKMLVALEKKDQKAVADALYNAFEQVILPANPEAARLKALFLEQGAAGALMSGSGAAVFGLFEEEWAARQSCDALRAAGYFAVVAPVIREAN